NRVAMEANRVQCGEIGIPLPDPVAIAIALDPAVCTAASDHYVDVETHSDLTRGMTVVDRLNVAADTRNRATWADLLRNGRRMRVCWRIDVPRWKQILFDVLK